MRPGRRGLAHARYGTFNVLFHHSSWHHERRPVLSLPPPLRITNPSEPIARPRWVACIPPSPPPPSRPPSLSPTLPTSAPPRPNRRAGDDSRASQRLTHRQLCDRSVGSEGLLWRIRSARLTIRSERYGVQGGIGDMQRSESQETRASGGPNGSVGRSSSPTPLLKGPNSTSSAGPIRQSFPTNSATTVSPQPPPARCTCHNSPTLTRNSARLVARLVAAWRVKTWRISYIPSWVSRLKKYIRSNVHKNEAPGVKDKHERKHRAPKRSRFLSMVLLKKKISKMHPPTPLSPMPYPPIRFTWANSSDQRDRSHAQQK